MRERGTVKKFYDDRGFGFLSTGNGDLYVHHSAIEDMPGFRTLASGERVTFVRGPDLRDPSRERAFSVRRESDDAPGAGDWDATAEAQYDD